jgi:hypothetical protein
VLIKTRLLSPQQKPGPGSEIDWGHPLSRGLVGCWLFNEGAGKLSSNLVGMGRATFNAGVLWKNGGIYFPGTSVDWVTCSDRADYDLTTQGTLMCRAKPLGSYPNGFRGLISRATGGVAGTIQYNLDWYGIDPARTLRGIASDGTTLYTSEASYDFAGACRQTAFAWSPGARAIYADGKRLSSAGSTPAAKSISVSPNIGRSFSSGSYSWYGDIDTAAIYARAITPDDIRWLAAEPYAMIRYAGPPRRYFTVTGLDQVFRLREQPQRFRLKELGPRFALREMGPRFTLTEKAP